MKTNNTFKIIQPFISILLTSLLFTTMSTKAQVGSSYQISGDMVLFGDAVDFEISLDNKMIVYTADQDTNGTIELYSVNVSNGNVSKLNRQVVSGVGVRDFLISDDSQTVVYVAQNGAGTENIFSVPIGGGDSTRLNTSITGGDISRFVISPDSLRVVFSGSIESEDVIEIFSVPIGGGNQDKLNPSLVRDGNVSSGFRVTNNSQTVVYVADQENNGVLEIFSVPITGGTNTKLNDQFSTNTDVFTFTVSPNSQRVVYGADKEVDGQPNIYSVPITGGAPVKLNAINNDTIDRYEISPDNSRVVYIANSNIYSEPLNGGIVTQLNPLTIANIVQTFSISPDSSHVVYTIFQNFASTIELFKVPLIGGSATKLSPDGFSGISSFAISANSEQVVFLANQGDDIQELYSTPINGGNVAKINTPITNANQSFLFNFQITADSQRVIYKHPILTDEIHELFSAPINGGTQTKLNDDLPFNGDVDSFKISPDGSFVVYQADQDVFDEIELFAHRLIDDNDEDVEQNDDLCVPVKASNGKIALICL